MNRSRANRTRVARPSIEGLEGRLLLSGGGKGKSPAAVARSRMQAGNSPDVPTLDTPLPIIHTGIDPADDPTGTGVVFSRKVRLKESINAPFGTVWLGRGPRGQFTTYTQAAYNGVYQFDIVAKPGDNLVRLFASSTSLPSYPNQFSETATFRFVVADAVVGWDAVAIKAVQNADLYGPEAARVLATVHVAQYDAIASIRSPQSALQGAVAATKGASESAAATNAAYGVLVSLFPDQRSLFDNGLNAARTTFTDTRSIHDGEAVGNQVATNIVNWRHADETAPFLVANPTSLLPAAPPTAGTPAYDTALAEVRSVGEKFSTTRTDRQTLTAWFWDNIPGSPTNPGQWNQALSRLAVEGRTSLWANARSFALLDVALADAGSISQAAKSTYQEFRPQSVITQTTDPSWVSLVPTLGDYGYNSDQAAYATAASAVLSSIYGPKTPVAISSTELNSTRVYDSFAQAADDAAQSGVYGGVQFRFDVSAGTKLGESVARDVLARFPTKTK